MLHDSLSRRNECKTYDYPVANSYTCFFIFLLYYRRLVLVFTRKLASQTYCSNAEGPGLILLVTLYYYSLRVSVISTVFAVFVIFRYFFFFLVYTQIIRSTYNLYVLPNQLSQLLSGFQRIHQCALGPQAVYRYSPESQSYIIIIIIFSGYEQSAWYSGPGFVVYIVRQLLHFFPVSRVCGDQSNNTAPGVLGN